MQHSMRLDDEDVQAIVEWAEANGPLDVDPATPIEPVEQAGPELAQDLELRMPEPFVGSVDQEDDYRCFTLDPGLDEPAAITGYEFPPDQVPIVHHTLVYRLRAESVPQLDAAAAHDDDPGWECFGDINVRGTSVSPSGRGGGSDLVMGWAPGQPASVFSDGAAIQLDAGDVFVMQLHYNITEDPPPDQSAIVLQLADDPAALDDITVTTYLAPAEIPCPAEETAPGCDTRHPNWLRSPRSTVPSVRRSPTACTRCAARHQDNSAVLEDGVARTSCDHQVRNTGEILAVLGHMHEIGRSFRMTLNPDTGCRWITLAVVIHSDPSGAATTVRTRPKSPRKWRRIRPASAPASTTE